MARHSKYGGLYKEVNKGKKRKCIMCKKVYVVGFKFCGACKAKAKKMNIGTGA